MADPNLSHPQFGQILPQQFRPPLPNQDVYPAGQRPAGQGPPKMANMPLPPLQGQHFQSVPPNTFTSTGPPLGQGPPQHFNSGPPTVGGSVNGFPPASSQNYAQMQGPMDVNRPAGPPPHTSSTSTAPQVTGSVHPPVSGQFVPPGSSYNNSTAPFMGVRPTLNGTNTPPLQGFQQPLGNPPSHFQSPPMLQDGTVSGPTRLPTPSSNSPSNIPGPPRMGMALPSTGHETGMVSSPLGKSAPGIGTSNSGVLSPPSELPVPFHGQAQYSHQIGATMKFTPNPTPSNSEPPSQRSSRGPSPVNEQSYDALEGQFSPGQGTPAASSGQGQAVNSPFPSPTGPASQVPYLPSQSQGITPPGQRMPPPPRPGAPSPQGTGTGPAFGATLTSPVAMGQQQRPGYHPHMPQYPVSMPPSRQPVPLARFPGLPSGPLAGPPGPSSGPAGLHGPPSGLPVGPPSGPPSGPPVGPPSGPPIGPPGPPSGPTGPQSGLPAFGSPSGPPHSGPVGPHSGLVGPPSGPVGPFNLGPPTSQQSSAPGSNYYQQPPASQQSSAPGSNYYPQPPASQQSSAPGSNYYLQPPASQSVRPSSGSAGPPSGPIGPYSNTHLGQGYPQPTLGQGHPQPTLGQGHPQSTLGQNAVSNMAGDFNKLGVNDSQRVINLMQEKKLISTDGVETARPNLYHDHKRVNCNPEVFRCTLNAIPQNSALLNKARLPLGILIHPFKDLSQLPVIQSSVIVRCRSCRTYINPFVTFVDQRRWKCNLCFRVNELPDEFSFDPVTKTYGDPQRRPEIKSATIEFIAPSEYMLRPPQPAVYLFLLDVSFNAVETGYLRLFTQTLIEELDRLPGDARTQIGFLCFDRSLYFFNLWEGLSQPQMMVMPDLEDVFLPCPDNLLVNLHESREMVIELLNQLPSLFEGNHETGNALGTALQAAFKLMSSTGGRVTVMQTMLPTGGSGALENREAVSQASSLNASNLGPASDFYKKLALDCSAQQIAVDLFMLNGQYADIATVSCISKYSAGCVQYYPSFHTVRNPTMSDKFEQDLRRYFTRKIGFESVMRIRCTRGVSIHTFHGNFFVRSTDLLSLPNVNPDAGFGMQMSIEDNLTESSNVCFQAALLYTSSKGERRIRVHSLCVPITNQLNEVFASADQQAIASLLAKMAADRAVSSSLEDARDAMMNACQDMMNAFATQVPASQRVGALIAPPSLRLVPLFTLAMLKSSAFRLSASIKVDERVFAHLLAKVMPTSCLLQMYYPHLYPVHTLNEENIVENNSEKIPKAPRLQLSSANIDRHGVYVMDQGESMYLMVGSAVSDTFCQEVFDVPNFMSTPEGLTDLPELENPTSERLRSFISHLMDSRPGGVSFLVLREDSKMRQLFFQHMVEDRTESSMSYYEFLQFVQQKVKG